MKLRIAAFAVATMLATPSLAADVVGAAPPPPKANPFDGFYLGGHVGYGWANRNGCIYKQSFVHEIELIVETVVEENPCYTDSEVKDLQLYGYGFPFDYDQTGWILGAQTGINHFLGGSNFMIGAEVSASLSGITGNLDLGHVGGVGDWTYLGTATGKIGIALNKVLLYAEAGVGVGGFRFNSSSCNFESNHQGWVYGGGVEVALNTKNTIFVEYNHFDFNTKTAYCGSFPFSFSVETKPTINVVKVGFNHFFN
jgi:outer membrane immunogenic protein